MLKFIRTNSEDKDFLEFVRELDADLAIRDGEERDFYNQFNKLDLIKNVIVAYVDKTPAGCGAIKQYSPDTMEVKRMFTPPQFRSRGLASLVLAELEKWALELGYTKCILETGKRQPEAIALYKKNGYKIIPNYGQYEGILNSVCFEKVLSQIKQFRITEDYKTQYTDPIVLQTGDTVITGREEQSEKWKGWIWAETRTHKGWVPKQILKIFPDSKTAEVIEYYTAKELDVAKGDIVQKVRSLNGWTWSKNKRTGEEGWIPDEIISSE